MLAVAVAVAVLVLAGGCATVPVSSGSSSSIDAMASTPEPFPQVPSRLDGNWRLTGLIVDRGALPVPVDSTVSADIGFGGGQVRVHTGCNSGGGPAQIDERTITFGLLRSTLVGCSGSDQKVEDAMRLVLQGPVPYTLAESPSPAILTILGADGSSGLVFTADQ